MFPVYFRSTSAPDETNFSLFQFRLYELSILNRFRLTSGPFPVQFKVHLVCWKFQYMNMVKIENFVSRCTIIWSTWWCRKSFDWCRCLKLENFFVKNHNAIPLCYQMSSRNAIFLCYKVGPKPIILLLWRMHSRRIVRKYRASRNQAKQHHVFLLWICLLYSMEFQCHIIRLS